MVEENPKPEEYAPCKHIKRVKPVHELNEELANKISMDYRTFPCFEKTLFDYLYTNHYSLERNELLRCRWNQYRQHVAGRVTQPIQFPSSRDIHFYKGNVKFVPSQSIHRVTDFRMKLKPGPGVDWRGQMPIPNELLLKRGISEKEDIGTGNKARVKKATGKKHEKKVRK